jgi:hypothetical protein
VSCVVCGMRSVVIMVVILCSVASCTGGAPSAATAPSGDAAGGGAAAVTIAPGVFLCPPRAPVIGWRGRFYPQGYPASPPSRLRPDACFHSAGAAKSAGLRLAATPQGDVDVGGVYLVPAARSVGRLCREAAKETTFAVPCPTLVPYPADSVGFCGGEGQMCWSRSGFLLLGYFLGPPGYRGVGGTIQGHLWIEADTPRHVSSINCCGATQTHRPTGPFGRSARWLVFPPGTSGNSGHVVLEWRRGPAIYAVSLHGHDAINYTLDLTIATHLRYLPSTSNSG